MTITSINSEETLEIKNKNKEFTTIVGKDPTEIVRRNSSDLKKFDEYRLLWKKASNLEVITSYPIQLDFELNYSCNFTCQMCSWSMESNANKGKNTWFDFDMYKSIISDGVKKGLKSIRLNHINEPLIRRDIIDFIKFAKEQGILDIYLSTNGSLLTQEMSELLIESGLTRIQISIDAHSKKTFDTIRQGGDFEKITQNIIDFISLRDNKKKELPVVRVNFVKTDDNLHELDKFKIFWIDKADCIGIQDLFDLKKYNIDSDEKIFNCALPFLLMLIRHDGSILPCCSFVSDDLVLGKIKNNSKSKNDPNLLLNQNKKKLKYLSIEDAWNCAGIKELRKIHINGQYSQNTTCKKCINSSQTFD